MNKNAIRNNTNKINLEIAAIWLHCVFCK